MCFKILIYVNSKQVVSSKTYSKVFPTTDLPRGLGLNFFSLVYLIKKLFFAIASWFAGLMPLAFKILFEMISNYIRKNKQCSQSTLLLFFKVLFVKSFIQRLNLKWFHRSEARKFMRLKNIFPRTVWKSEIVTPWKWLLF